MISYSGRHRVSLSGAQPKASPKPFSGPRVPRLNGPERIVPRPTVSTIDHARLKARWSGVSVGLQLYDEGKSVEEIMQATGRAKATVYRWIAFYRNQIGERP